MLEKTPTHRSLSTERLSSTEQVLKVATSVVAGSALGSAIPIPGVGTAVGAAAGAAVGAASKAIKKSRKDDVFEPKKVQLELDRFPSAGGQIPGSKEKVRFRDFQGHYVVTYSWSIS